MAITKFRGEHYFLSNMFPLPNGLLTPDGVTVHTSEQLYLAARVRQQAGRLAIEHMPNGFAANNLFRKLVVQGIPVEEDSEAKVELMRSAVRAKFAANPDLAQQLRETGDELLIEGNRWGDRFWGISPPPPEGVGNDWVTPKGSGDNWLGRILMDLRNEVSSPDYAPQVGEMMLRLFAHETSTNRG